MIASALTIRGTARLANGEPMPFAVPDADVGDFLREVEPAERARLRELFIAFAEIAAARSIKAGSEAAAAKRQHLGRGWSAKNLRQLFFAYRDGGHKPGDFRKTGPRYRAGDWRVLLRDYKGRDTVLPEEFVRWLSEQWAQFKGRTDVVEATWRHVVYEVWLKGQPVPGYGTVDEWCLKAGVARPHPHLVRQSQLPDGWSIATFRRRLPKRVTVRKQVAHGYLAAHNAQPDQVLTDRSALLPLQYIFMDDSRPDLRCTWFGPGGRGEIVYPLLVLGLDACSGVDVAHCFKPRGLRSPESESETERRARHGVTQDMALRVVVETLRRGLPPWPITFVHENAAACIPSEIRHEIEAVFGDRVQFMATGIFKERMIAHGFADIGGAPYDKAPIEAFWRIMMTQIARLPGSTGPRYDTAPGELKQIEKYTLGLIEKAGGLAEVFSKFRSPLLDFPAACDAIDAALRLLRFRTQHKLQGFERIREWRRSPADQYRPWHEFLALPSGDQNAISTSADKDAIIARLESPAERFCRLLQGQPITQVDPDFLLWLQGPREKVRVLNGKITVSRVELGTDALIFRETDHPLLGEEHEGQTFEAVIAPEGDRIVLTEEGRLLGSVSRQDRISRADQDAIRREQGRVRAARVADREYLREYYLADTDTALAELRAHNEATAASLELPAAPKTPRLAAGRTREKRRAQIDAEIAAAERQAGASEIPTTGSLYDTSSDA